MTIDDSSVTETNNTQQQEQQERKLSQKRKTLVSGDVLLESQMSVPRSYLLPLSAIQKHRPPETCPIKRFLPSGESSSQRPRPPGFEVRMRTLATPQPRLPSRERLSLHPWISFTCNSAFWSGPHFFVFFVKFILEAERERGRGRFVVPLSCAFVGFFLDMLLTRYQTCNLGISGLCCNQPSYPARAMDFISSSSLPCVRHCARYRDGPTRFAEVLQGCGVLSL